MLWEKNQKKEVFFTEEAADKQLLAAIEKELSTQKYQTFSNLCKQALWQFLYVSSSSELAQPASNLQRLEHKIYEKLTQQFSELEKKLASAQPNQLNSQLNQLTELEEHLNKLTQQLTQMQLNFDAQLRENLDTLKKELPKIEAAIRTKTESTIKPARETEFISSEPEKIKNDSFVEEPVTEKDPLLQRLSPLLEDF